MTRGQQSDIALYGRVPEALIYLDHPQAGLALRVFAALDRHRNEHRGKAWPKRRTLAGLLHVSEASIDRAIGILIDHGFLAVERRGQHLPNEYTLVFPLPSESSQVTSLDDSESSPVTSQTPPESSQVTTPIGKRERAKESGAGSSPVKTQTPSQAMFNALVAACGLNAAELTSSARGALNRAIKDLLAVGATPEEVPRRAAAYRRKYDNAELTPSALAKNWAQVMAKAPSAQPRPPLMAPVDDLPPDHANGIAAIRQARQAMRVG